MSERRPTAAASCTGISKPALAGSHVRASAYGRRFMYLFVIARDRIAERDTDEEQYGRDHRKPAAEGLGALGHYPSDHGQCRADRQDDEPALAESAARRQEGADHGEHEADHREAEEIEDHEQRAQTGDQHRDLRQPDRPWVAASRSLLRLNESG